MHLRLCSSRSGVRNRQTASRQTQSSSPRFVLVLSVSATPSAWTVLAHVGGHEVQQRVQSRGILIMLLSIFNYYNTSLPSQPRQLSPSLSSSPSSFPHQSQSHLILPCQREQKRDAALDEDLIAIIPGSPTKKPADTGAGKPVSRARQAAVRGPCPKPSRPSSFYCPSVAASGRTRFFRLMTSNHPSRRVQQPQQPEAHRHLLSVIYGRPQRHRLETHASSSAYAYARNRPQASHYENPGYG